MARMQKTVDKAEETAASARETVTTGMDETRTVAAEVLNSIGSGVRHQTRRASRATEKTGSRIADAFEGRAEQVRGRKGGSLFGYFRRHPMQLLLLLGIMTGVLALIAVPVLGKARAVEDEFDPYL